MATPSSLHQAAWAHILSMSTAPLPIGHPRPPVSPSAHLQPPVYGCVQMASMLSRPLCSTDIATQLLEAQGLSGNASPGMSFPGFQTAAPPLLLSSSVSFSERQPVCPTALNTHTPCCVCLQSQDLCQGGPTCPEILPPSSLPPWEFQVLLRPLEYRWFPLRAIFSSH